MDTRPRAKAKSTHQALLVDVTTGQLYEFSTKRKGVVIPERNPDSGKISLFPVRQDEQGNWIIESRYLSDDAIAEVEGEPNNVNFSTGRVEISSEKVNKVTSR
ncbi:MAG: hypothetical protein ACF8LK_03350 [Phycisphaerales bacterium JB041]